MTKKTTIIGFFLTVVIIILGICKNYTIIISKNDECKIGVIDTNLSIESEKYIDNTILLTNQTQFDSRETTHGDLMVEFSHLLNKDAKLYYYSAIDKKNGKITSQNLIDGLIWMKENEVKYVNISLSSKHYSKELEKWIEKNSSNMKVFSSYSNNRNTYDYPAGYSAVIGSASDSIIALKQNDVRYNSNNIIFLPSMHMYKGNSFLSIISMMDAIK